MGYFGFFLFVYYYFIEIIKSFRGIVFEELYCDLEFYMGFVYIGGFNIM